MPSRSGSSRHRDGENSFSAQWAFAGHRYDRDADSAVRTQVWRNGTGTML
jgi:hypothetical protein